MRARAAAQDPPSQTKPRSDAAGRRAQTPPGGGRAGRDGVAGHVRDDFEVAAIARHVEGRDTVLAVRHVDAVPCEERPRPSGPSPASSLHASDWILEERPCSSMSRFSRSVLPISSEASFTRSARCHDETGAAQRPAECAPVPGRHGRVSKKKPTENKLAQTTLPLSATVHTSYYCKESRCVAASVLGSRL